MRKLFHIGLAAVALISSRAYSTTSTNSTTLAFYVVSKDKIDAGRFIDTPEFPRLGYIATKPDLVITRLVAVSETHPSKPTVDKDGRWMATPSDEPALDVQILSDDSQKLEALTKQNIGKQVLLMLGDTPLIAPVVRAPISTQGFMITIKEQSKQKVVEDALKRLVH
jgi:hypothetical protein